MTSGFSEGESQSLKDGRDYEILSMIVWMEMLGGGAWHPELIFEKGLADSQVCTVPRLQVP